MYQTLCSLRAAIHASVDEARKEVKDLEIAVPENILGDSSANTNDPESPISTVKMKKEKAYASEPRKQREPLRLQDDFPKPAAPLYIVCHTKGGNCGSSVSTVTGGIRWDDEDSESGTSHGDDVSAVETIQTTKRIEAATSDEFGSIACSTPR